MDKDDLLKMFGLSEKPKTEDKEPLNMDKGSPDEPTSFGDYQDTVIDLSEYEKDQGKNIHKPWQKQAGIDELAMADMFGCAFQIEPKVNERPADNVRHGFIKALMETPDYKSLHDMSKANTVISKMTAESFSKEYKKVLDQLAGYKKFQEENNWRKEKNKKHSKTNEQLIYNAHAMMAVEEANEEAEFLFSTMRMMGKEPGDMKGRMDATGIVTYYNRIKNSRYLKRICELAGPYRFVAQSKQRMKTKHGYDDMVGVELTGVVSKLLPVELAKIADEDLQWEVLIRLASNQCLGRQYRGIEPQGKGPIVICLDESNSMKGEPICQAKAFALAMAWIARHQKRVCILVSFSNADQHNILVMRPEEWNEEALLNWLEHFFDGGTDFNIPLIYVPKCWRVQNLWNLPYGKTDMFVITDGECNLPYHMKESFLKFKTEEKVKLYTIAIGCDPGPIGEVSDEIYRVNSIDVNEKDLQRTFTI